MPPQRGRLARSVPLLPLPEDICCNYGSEVVFHPDAQARMPCGLAGRSQASLVLACLLKRISIIPPCSHPGHFDMRIPCDNVPCLVSLSSFCQSVQCLSSCHSAHANYCCSARATQGLVSVSAIATALVPGHTDAQQLPRGSQRKLWPSVLKERGVAEALRASKLSSCLPAPCLCVADGTPEGFPCPADLHICHPQHAITRPLRSIPAQQRMDCGHTEGAQAPVRARSGSQVL